MLCNDYHISCTAFFMRSSLVVECKICKQQFSGYRALSRHIKHVHDVDKKEYYDKYLKKENEGMCLNCNKPTEFRRLDFGYKLYCCKLCRDACSVKNWRKTMNERYNGGYYLGTAEGQEKLKEAFLRKYGTEYVWQSDEIKNKSSETMLKRLRCKTFYAICTSKTISKSAQRSYKS